MAALCASLVNIVVTLAVIAVPLHVIAKEITRSISFRSFWYYDFAIAELCRGKCCPRAMRSELVLHACGILGLICCGCAPESFCSLSWYCDLVT